MFARWENGNIDRKQNVCATMFPKVGKQGNIDGKLKVFVTMFQR